MAFWKKSEDPWDIDPEKRKRQQAVYWEQEAAQSAEIPEETDAAPAQAKGDRLGDTLDNFFKKKDEEPPQAEKCPYCGGEMKWGVLSGGRDGVVWRNWKSRGLGLRRPEGWKEIDLLDEGELFLYKTLWYCVKCGKMVMDAPAAAKRYTWESTAGEQSEEKR